jgi:tetratricopeptide (TPR) repeat protein
MSLPPLPDSQKLTAKPAASSKPVVLIPVTEADVFRKRLKIGAGIAAGVLLIAVIAWLIFNQSTKRLEADQALENGQQLYRIGRFNEAILAFSRAADLNPRLADAYYWRARGYIAVSDYGKAIRDLTTYLEARPTDAAGWTRRAECHQEEKQYAKAIADFDKAIELNPNAASTYVSRGISRRLAGQTQEALADFEKAIELAGDIGAYFEHGALLQNLGQHQRAVEDFSKVIATKPDAPAAYLARALSRRVMGDEAGARADYAMGQRLEGRP